MKKVKSGDVVIADYCVPVHKDNTVWEINFRLNKQKHIDIDHQDSEKNIVVQIIKQFQVETSKKTKNNKRSWTVLNAFIQTAHLIT